jgi:hypothetical protein
MAIVTLVPTLSTSYFPRARVAVEGPFVKRFCAAAATINQGSDGNDRLVHDESPREGKKKITKQRKI